MYVDVSEMKRCALPNNIRAWTEIDRANSIFSIYDSVDKNKLSQPQYRNVRYVEDNLKPFVCTYLSDIAKAKYMNAMKEEHNNLTLRVLESTELIVDFGFFDTINELESLVRTLIKIINSTIDVTNQTEKDITKSIIAILNTNPNVKSVNQLLKKQKGIIFNRSAIGDCQPVCVCA